MSHDKYEYPLLPFREILLSFNESNITITDMDLQSPDPRRWHGIYAQMFDALTGRSIEQVIQSLFRVERMQTDYYDLFEEGFAQMAFTSCIQRVLCSCGFDSFSVKDLIKPTPKRVQHIASVFINTQRHNQMRRAYAKDTLERVQKSRGQFESVLNRNKELKELLAQAKEIQPQRDEEHQKLQEEFEREQQFLSELNKHQEEERRSVEDLKLKVAELETEKGNMRQVLGVVQQDSEKMSHKIVQSPKRFRQELERHKNKVVEMKAELSKKEHALSENRHLLEQTLNKLTAIEKAVKLSRGVQSDLEKENEIDTEILHLTDGHHEQKEVYNTCYAQEEDLTEKLKVRREQRQKIANQIDIREQSTHQQLTDLKQHRDKIHEKVRNLEAEASQFQSRMAGVENEMKDLDRFLEERKLESQRQTSEILEEISVLEETVANGWSDFKAIMLDDDSVLNSA